MCWAPYTRTPPRTAPLYGYCPKGGTTTHSGHECANMNSDWRLAVGGARSAIMRSGPPQEAAQA